MWFSTGTDGSSGVTLGVSLYRSHTRRESRAHTTMQMGCKSAFSATDPRDVVLQVRLGASRELPATVVISNATR